MKTRCLVVFAAALLGQAAMTMAGKDEMITSLVPSEGGVALVKKADFLGTDVSPVKIQVVVIGPNGRDQRRRDLGGVGVAVIVAGQIRVLIAPAV